jgi:hypothetical protein
MLSSFGWTLQLLGLAIVGSSLLFGLIYDQIRLELAVAAGGTALFLLGRWLQSRAGH